MDSMIQSEMMDSRDSKKLEVESTEGRKLGIVYHSRELGKEPRKGINQVSIYLVDVDCSSTADDYAHVKPAVRFVFPISDNVYRVCVLKSTVYIFGGSIPSTYYESDYKYAAEYVSSLEPQADKEVNLGPSMADKEIRFIPPMKHTKVYPLAMPTPDGQKILVFSFYIVVGESSKAIELFDPKSKGWELLPGLPENCCCKVNCHYSSCSCITEVTAYSFLDDSHFFMEIYKVGSFVLDLGKKEWIEVLVPPLRKIEVEDYFVTAKKRYVLSDGGHLHDLSLGGFFGPSEDEDGIGKRFCRIGPSFPLSTFDPQENPDRVRLHTYPLLVAVNQGDDDVCRTYFLTAEITVDGKESRLLIDACETDLHTLNTTVSKTFKLLIDSLPTPYSIY